MRGTEDERERDAVEVPTALRRPVWPYVLRRYSCVDICRRPEDDRALLLRLELGRADRVAVLRPGMPREPKARVPLLRPAEELDR